MFAEDLKEAKEKLDILKNNWDTNPENLHQLDSNWVAVIIPKKQWRVAKEAGAKKDSYWGWVLWSSSKQECGSNYAVEAFKIASEYGLLTRERQL